MNNLHVGHFLGAGAVNDAVPYDPFGNQSRQEPVRDEVVLSPPLSADERLAKGIREMPTNPVDVK